MKKIVFLTSFLLVSLALFSLEVPPLKGAINDFANILKEEERAELESLLMTLNQETKIQIALLIIPSLQDESLEAYAAKVFEKWKLGDEKLDSGALLLVAKNDRKLRIEVGYGLEKDITDVIASRIINKIIVPSFKSEKYYEGIKGGLNAMIAYAKNDETLINEVKDRTKGTGKIASIIFLIIWYILVALSSKWNFFWPITLFLYGLGFGKRHRSGGSYSGGGTRWSILDFDSIDSDNDSGSSFSGRGGRSGGGGASGSW